MYLFSFKGLLGHKPGKERLLEYVITVLRFPFFMGTMGKNTAHWRIYEIDQRYRHAAGIVLLNKGSYCYMTISMGSAG